MEALNFFYLAFTSEFMTFLLIPDEGNRSCLYYACLFAKSVDIVEIFLEIMDERDLLGNKMSRYIKCLLAAKEGEGPQNAEIQQLFLDYFNKKMMQDFKDVEEVFAYYRHVSSDDDLD